MHVRKNDLVEVISGNDKGTRGRVLRILNKKDRVVVQGVNLRWKHMRKSQQYPQGGRVRREIPIHVSNVMLYDEGAEVRSRAGASIVDGKKERVLRKTGKPVGAAPAAKKEKATKAKAKAKAKPEKES